MRKPLGRDGNEITIRFARLASEPLPAVVIGSRGMADALVGAAKARHGPKLVGAGWTVNIGCLI
jgi:hypothetical protein